MSEFQPEIIAFCCKYCAYAAADLAGSMRLSYPTNIKIIQIPCTGKVDALYLLKAFQSGADGVYVAGCLEGNCHFLTGNLRARKRVEYAKKILDEIGIGGERLEMYNMSAAQGSRFVEVAHEMTERIKKLGPNPIKRAASAASKDSATQKRMCCLNAVSLFETKLYSKTDRGNDEKHDEETTKICK